MPRVGTYKYPNVTIDEALSYVRIFVNKRPRGEMSKETFAREVLGRSPTSSAVDRLIASIAQYGLIKHEKGKIFITDLGKRAVAGIPEEVKLNAVREALENVDLIKEYWEEHGGTVDDKIVAIFLREICGADEIQVSRCLPTVSKILKAAVKWMEKITLKEERGIAATEPTMRPAVQPVTPALPSEIPVPSLTFEKDYIVYRVPRRYSEFFMGMHQKFMDGFNKLLEYLFKQEMKEVKEGKRQLTLFQSQIKNQ